MSGTGKLNFLSWNVNGLKNKIHKVKQELRRLDPDVVFLQETRIGKPDSQIFNDPTYQFFHASYNSRCRGVAILVKKAKVGSEPKVIQDDNGCYILVNINICGEQYNLVSMYNAKGDTRLLSNLTGILKDRKDGVLVIGGDFNTALNPEEDCINPQRIDKKPKENLQKFIKILKLKDTWRVLNPTQKKYTYVVKSRIDYLFVPETDAVSINKCEIEKSRISDHNPVSLTLSHKLKGPAAHPHKRKLVDESGKSSTNYKKSKGEKGKVEAHALKRRLVDESGKSSTNYKKSKGEKGKVEAHALKRRLVDESGKSSTNYKKSKREKGKVEAHALKRRLVDESGGSSTNYKKSKHEKKSSRGPCIQTIKSNCV